MDARAARRARDLEHGRERAAVSAPPYVSFNTFRTLLEWLKTEGVPLRFDRSFWQAKFSGSNGTQLVAALRFLRLLEGGRPLPGLERLVNATPEERRFLLAGLLLDSYAGVPFDELPRATPAMVKAWFRAYPIDGHTMRKAISFFVNAAKEADIPMSNAVRKMAKSKATEGRAALHEVRPAAAAEQRGRAHSRTTVELESGGVVTVDMDVDLFRLSDRDREFVLGLVGLTRGYQDRNLTRSP